jgi:hypothetical protein
MVEGLSGMTWMPLPCGRLLSRNCARCRLLLAPLGLALLGLLGGPEDARAQESPAGPAVLQEEAARRAFDSAIIDFNTGIQRFPTWDAFATALAAAQGADARGTCYAHSGGRVQVTHTMLPPPAAGPPWQQTAGGGWRQQQPDRTVVEYRFNATTSAVLWSVGVHPRWFVAYTTQLCVLPLGSPRPVVGP